MRPVASPLPVCVTDALERTINQHRRHLPGADFPFVATQSIRKVL